MTKTWPSLSFKNTSFGKYCQAMLPKKRSYDWAAKNQATNPIIAHMATGAIRANATLRTTEFTVPGSPKRPQSNRNQYHNGLPHHYMGELHLFGRVGANVVQADHPNQVD